MDVFCITNHDLLPDSRLAEMTYKSWREPYIEAITAIARTHPKAIVLREKLLSGIDYTNLYQTFTKRIDGVEVIWHDHFEALKLFMRFHKRQTWPDAVFFSGREAGALSTMDLKALHQENIRFGLTCHSSMQLDDAKRAGADFVVASHIYETNCKRGVKPKGIHFLEETVRSSDVPVIALGGITPDNAEECRAAGAAGVAVMSLAMDEDKEPLNKLIAL